MKKGFCKLCNLNSIILRHIENMIRDEGHREIKQRIRGRDRTPGAIHRAKTGSHKIRKLSAEQICYVVYLIFDIEIERHLIYKHKKHMS